jgi:HK97 family phage portal protein
MLIHLKNINTSNHKIGTSYLIPILEEIKIIIYGNTYNSNSLKNGARLDGIFSYQGTLTPENEKNMKNTWQQFFNGIKNAGKTLFLNVGQGEIDYKPMSKSNKDMDFISLIDRATISIYKRFKIPLPLIETKGQTYNNYAEAQAQLFDNAIEPILSNILMQLQQILVDKKIEINKDTLPLTAKIKGYDLALRQNEAGIFTINEIRAGLGLEPLTGGDILRDSTKTTPIAYAGNNPDISLYDVNTNDK